MKFQKLEKISLRNETKNYLAKYFNFNKYHLYWGVIKDHFGIFASENEITDEHNFESVNKITFCNENYELGDIDKLLVNSEKTGDKFIEIYLLDGYIKFPVSLDFIDWLKAETEIFNETKDDYKKITLPYINSIRDKNIKWINELLFNKSEESLVLKRTSKWVITKDIIWKDTDPSNFYILAIPLKQIKTIRELTQEDIPLLEELKTECELIAKTYGINKTKLYMYFHYHPSYYQLHLHVSIIDHQSLETNYYRHIFLDDVIDGLNKDSKYWFNSTLKFELLSGTKLYKLLKENQKQ
jgi:hypothetical protein